MLLMDYEGFLSWLRQEVRMKHNTQLAFARAHDIAPQQLSAALNGNRPVPKRILRALGVRLVVRYQLPEISDERADTTAAIAPPRAASEKGVRDLQN